MTVKIDQKGRLVLPKEARQRLGILNGAKLELEYSSLGIILRPRGKVTLKDLCGIIKIKKPIPIEEIENAAGLTALD